MARPKKFDYDSGDFYDEILALAMQGLTDAEIADSLADKFGQSLSQEAFSTMNNGCYDKWSDEESQRRSARFVKVLAHGRRKITSIGALFAPLRCLSCCRPFGGIMIYCV